MTNWNILLESARDGQTTATVLELPSFQSTAKTRQNALEKIQQRLTQRLSQAEVVTLSIPDDHSDNPWINFGGTFQDDPDFADIAKTIQSERIDAPGQNGCW